MTENVFEAVKQSVSTRDAAAFYGIEVKRNGMACCPFHDDKNPSMKLNEEYFYCFGCGATGDVIDFTAKLFDLSPKEAAEKLAQDFGLIYDSQAPPRRRYVRQKTEAQKFREDRQRCYRVLSDYYYLLKKWEADNSPRTPEEEPHPRFVEAIQKKTYVEYGQSASHSSLHRHTSLYERKPCISGGVAQLGEHLPCKQGVRSSILLISTKLFYHRTLTTA